MDDYLQQQVAKRDSAQAFYDSLEKKYENAIFDFYESGSTMDLRTCFTFGDVLMEARVHVDNCEEALKSYQERVVEVGNTYVDEPDDDSEGATLTIAKFRRGVFIAITTAIVLIICVKIGW